MVRKASSVIREYFSVPTRADGSNGKVTLAELKDLRGFGIEDPAAKAKCRVDYVELAEGAAKELGVELSM